MLSLRKISGTILGIILMIYMLLCGWIYFSQEKLLFVPQRLPQDYVFQFGRPHREVYFTPEPGVKLHTVWIDALNPKGIVYYLHGNAGSIANLSMQAEDFLSRNYSVVLLDYRGYGKSTGDIREQDMMKDAGLVYHEIRRHWQDSLITVYGRSLGSGVAADVAAHAKPRRLILETPYYNLPDLARWHYPWLPVRLIVRYRFPTNELLPKVKCPVYIIHGTEDEVIPYKSSEKLARLLKPGDRFYTIKGGKHNELHYFPEREKILDEILGKSRRNDM